MLRIRKDLSILSNKLISQKAAVTKLKKSYNIGRCKLYTAFSSFFKGLLKVLETKQKVLSFVSFGVQEENGSDVTRF